MLGIFQSVDSPVPLDAPILGFVVVRTGRIEKGSLVRVVLFVVLVVLIVVRRLLLCQSVEVLWMMVTRPPRNLMTMD